MEPEYHAPRPGEAEPVEDHPVLVVDVGPDPRLYPWTDADWDDEA